MQSIKQECLDHFVVFGENHLRHIVSEYVAYHNEDRPHQGVGNTRLRVIGAKEPPVAEWRLGVPVGGREVDHG